VLGAVGRYVEVACLCGMTRGFPAAR
jgi:hypothetical protein